jgi:DNA-binding HxlR family transcriptional regulator
MTHDSTPPTDPHSDCPAKLGCINAALAILGDKWSPLLLKALAESPQAELRFGELEHLLVGISPRTLSQRLDMLLEAEVIKRSSYCDHPQRYCYRLTTKGHELEKVLAAMATWSRTYAPATDSRVVAE